MSIVNFFLSILYLVVLACLLIVIGIHPQISSHSKFELKRRSRSGSEEADILLKRQELIQDISSFQRVATAVLLVILSIIGVEIFHWAVGFYVSLVIALWAGALVRISPLQKVAQNLYEKNEKKIHKFIESHPTLFKTIRLVTPVSSEIYDIESKEELIEMVKHSGEVLTNDQKNLITNGLKFDSMLVETAMTPRSMIDSVPSKEILGPLVLDELHKTGHSRFPVIDEDVDHIVGMVYIQDLLKVSHGSKTYTATKIMDKTVYYIREDQSLQQALAAFLKVRHHLFVVVNEYRETVGLLSLEDVIEALLGHKIIDEFDAHEDLRKVAERNPRKNNSSQTSKNV